MRVARKLVTRLIVRTALTALTVGPAQAASMDLEWDPVAAADLAGYRLYFGTQPGTYTTSTDVGTMPSFSLGNLAGCTYYYVAIKARNSAGTISTEYSNVVEGFPHPEIVSLTPSSLRRGQTASVVVDGSGFVAGAFAAAGAGLVLSSSRVDGCSRMTVDVTVPESAPLGWAPLTVTNSDGGYETRPEALQILSADPGPDGTLHVVSVDPGPGAVGVDPRSAVHIVFSRPLDARTITSSRFKIQKAGTNGGASLADAPVLDAAGTTVSLGIDGALQAGESYAIYVKGGKNGVKDAGGQTLAASYEENPPFTTAGLFAMAAYTVPADVVTTETSLQPGSVVPATSTFIVRFSESMDPLSITSKTLKIRKIGKGKVMLVDGRPQLLADGASVLLIPADALEPSTSYELSVKGGGKGVASLRGVRTAASTRIVFTSTLASVAALGVAR